MAIMLKPEQEQIIQAEIASGRFRNPEEVVAHALRRAPRQER
jgi:Arc/MetJ-type ribon-helix-helix transcriptional regulator